MWRSWISSPGKIWDKNWPKRRVRSRDRSNKVSSQLLKPTRTQFISLSDPRSLQDFVPVIHCLQFALLFLVVTYLPESPFSEDQECGKSYHQLPSNFTACTPFCVDEINYVDSSTRDYASDFIYKTPRKSSAEQNGLLPCYLHITCIGTVVFRTPEKARVWRLNGRIDGQRTDWTEATT